MSTIKKMPTIAGLPLDDLSYEQTLAELETLVASLEAENHSLESTLAMFTRGQALARHCAEMLDQAELKVQQLAGSELVKFNPNE